MQLLIEYYSPLLAVAMRRSLNAFNTYFQNKFKWRSNLFCGYYQIQKWVADMGRAELLFTEADARTAVSNMAIARYVKFKRYSLFKEFALRGRFKRAIFLFDVI